MVLQIPEPTALQDKFGEIASPLWLHMPNVIAVEICHCLDEYFLALS